MAVRVLRELELEPTREFLQNELGHKLVQVVGKCRIVYQGRAESVLEEGERLILFKSDGTLLVHTDAKLKPVNWQPPGCSFQAAIENEQLILTCTREKPREVVRIEMTDVQAVMSMSLDDGHALDLVGTEYDLQALLAKQPDLVEPGFRFWSRERSSRRGPMDLYGEDTQGRRVIVEVKRRAAAVQDVEQLRRYVEKEREAREGKLVRGILIAPTVSDTARKYLGDLGLEWREINWEKLRKTAKTVLAAGQVTLGKWSGKP